MRRAEKKSNTGGEKCFLPRVSKNWSSSHTLISIPFIRTLNVFLDPVFSKKETEGEEVEK